LRPGSRRVIVGLLVGLYLLWPLVQQQLVLRYRVNSWRLGGWAMYATIKPRVRIDLFGVGADGRRVPLSTEASKDLVDAVGSYEIRRREFGLFADPRPVAWNLALAYEEFSKFVVRVDEIGLTDQSWIGTTHRVDYEFERGEDRRVEMVPGG
jgi:hypothetical protein